MDNLKIYVPKCNIPFISQNTPTKLQANIFCRQTMTILKIMSFCHQWKLSGYENASENFTVTFPLITPWVVLTLCQKIHWLHIVKLYHLHQQCTLLLHTLWTVKWTQLYEKVFALTVKMFMWIGWNLWPGRVGLQELCHWQHVAVEVSHVY